jgi:hypothetical protein
LLTLDNQSIKKVQFISGGTDIDGGKNVNGRKRTILVDKLDLSFAIKVTIANVSDNQSGIMALEMLGKKVLRLKKGGRLGV